MSETSPSPISTKKKKLAVLLLDRPPLPVMDWYGRKIAGVPFLLRNVLNIQRGGVDHLILYLNQNQDIDKELCRLVASDPRVKVPVQWITQPEPLVQAVDDGSHVLILEGASLHHKTEIASLRASDPNREGTGGGEFIFIDDKMMISLLRQPSGSNAFRFKKLQEGSSVKAREGERLLAYLPGSEEAKISRQEDFILQHQRLLKTGGGLGNDSFLTKIFSRSVSRLMTRFFIDTSFTPNQITFLSFALGLGSAWCFYHLDYWMGVAGGGLLLLAIWVDGVDGEIARIKFMETKLGGKLDIVCDNVVHVILFFSIGMGLYRTTGQHFYIYLGGLAACGSLVAFLLMGDSVIESKVTVTAKAKRKEKTLADKLANRDFTYFLLLTALAGKVEVFIGITAVGSIVFALYLIVCKIRSSKEQVKVDAQA